MNDLNAPAQGRGIGIMREAYRRFRSARTTVFIIAVLLVLFLFGLVIPQKSLFGSRALYLEWKTANPIWARAIELLGLNEIYTSPITVIFLALFFLNLLVVAAHRVPLILRKAFLRPGAPPAFDAAALRRDHDAAIVMAAVPAAPAKGAGRVREAAHQPSRDEALRAVIRQFLKKRLWTVIGSEQPGAMLAVRNRYSPFGFLLFHISFLLCLLGGLFVMYTRFSGYLVLTEGQEFHADMTQFSRITRDPKILRGLPPVGIVLEQVVPEYQQGVSTDLTVRMQVQYRNAIDPVVVKTNQPVKRGPVSILAESIGVSPLFVLRTREGAVLDGGYAALNVLDGKEDSFEFTGEPYRVVVRFFPDYTARDGEEYSASKELKNPHMRVRIEREGRTAGTGLLAVGQSLAFDSLRLSFEDVRYWVNFLIIREYGSAPLFIGFFLGAAGLVMRLVFFQKVIKIAWEHGETQSVLYIKGQSEYYTFSFGEEMRLFAEQLAATLQGRAASGAGGDGGAQRHGSL